MEKHQQCHKDKKGFSHTKGTKVFILTLIIIKFNILNTLKINLNSSIYSLALDPNLLITMSLLVRTGCSSLRMALQLFMFGVMSSWLS